MQFLTSTFRKTRKQSIHLFRVFFFVFVLFFVNPLPFLFYGIPCENGAFCQIYTPFIYKLLHYYRASESIWHCLCLKIWFVTGDLPFFVCDFFFFLIFYPPPPPNFMQVFYIQVSPFVCLVPKACCTNPLGYVLLVSFTDVFLYMARLTLELSFTFTILHIMFIVD